MNRHKCTITGKDYSEAQIQTNLSETYREVYTFEPMGACEGCGSRGTESAHIIPKARCKELHLTSLIWNPENFFRSCRRCNLIAENISAPAIKLLLNYQEIVTMYKRYDPEGFAILSHHPEMYKDL